MGVALTCLTAALALLPAVAGDSVLGLLDGRSRLAFALVPWLLFAGLPRRAAWRAGPALGLAALTLSLAAWLDVRAGVAAWLPAQRVAWGAVCGGVAWLAATRARGDAIHAALWFALWLVLPGLAALLGALAGGGAPGWTRMALALGAPSRALASAPDPGLVGADGIALASGLALLIAAERGARRRRLAVA